MRDQRLEDRFRRQTHFFSDRSSMNLAIPVVVLMNHIGDFSGIENPHRIGFGDLHPSSTFPAVLSAYSTNLSGNPWP
ncbi:hypothetical protein D3C75_1226770 [compost metagenome]